MKPQNERDQKRRRRRRRKRVRGRRGNGKRKGEGERTKKKKKRYAVLQHFLSPGVYFPLSNAQKCEVTFRFACLMSFVF